MAVDLIYRMDRTQKYDVPDAGFVLVDSLSRAIPRLPAMWRERGIFGTAKLLVKVVLRRCLYFGLAPEGKVLSSGVMTFGRCRFYPVAADAIVIGEIATDAANRGHGYATRAIMLAINSMIHNGPRAFYIDTQRENVSMIRSIEKLGFGRAIGGDAAGLAP